MQAKTSKQLEQHLGQNFSQQAMSVSYYRQQCLAKWAWAHYNRLRRAIHQRVYSTLKTMQNIPKPHTTWQTTHGLQTFPHDGLISIMWHTYEVLGHTHALKRRMDPTSAETWETYISLNDCLSNTLLLKDVGPSNHQVDINTLNNTFFACLGVTNVDWKHIWQLWKKPTTTAHRASCKLSCPRR